MLVCAARAFAVRVWLSLFCGRALSAVLLQYLRRVPEVLLLLLLLLLSSSSIVCPLRFLAAKNDLPLLSYAATADEIMDLYGAPPMTVLRTCQNDLQTVAALHDAIYNFGWHLFDVLYVHDSCGQNFVESLQRITEERTSFVRCGAVLLLYAAV